MSSVVKATETTATVPTAIEKLFTFPEMSYGEFETLPRFFKEHVLALNRITNTDTYNRTMSVLLTEQDWKVLPERKTELLERGGEGAMCLQMRRSPFNYLVVCGMQEMLDELLSIRITKEELRFAEEYYAKTKNPLFKPELWSYVVNQCAGKLPFEIHGVPDGTVLLPGEPVFTVRGNVELISHFEPLFHRVFYATLVATRAHALRQILGDPSRFIEVGKRGALDEHQHLLALRAMRVGGGFYLTSDDQGVGVLGLTDAGTMGHRYVQAFDSEEEAFRHAIKKLNNVSLLIDLVDSYRGIDLALKLKREYRDSGKKIWTRLDSGDILDQVRYFLRQTNALGLTDPDRDKLVVEGIDSFGEIAEIEAMIEAEFGVEAKKRVMYGAGGLLISEQTSRSDASTGFKLAEYTDLGDDLRASMKFSNSPGKESLPGATRLAVVDGRRTVLQLDEAVAGDVQELFQPFYFYGKRVDDSRTDLEAHKHAQQQFDKLFGERKTTKELAQQLRGKLSERTAAKGREVRKLYGLESLNTH